MSRVRIPTALRADVAGQRDVEIVGETVGGVLTTLVETYPGLASRLFRDGAIQPFMKVYLDGADIETLEGLATAARPDSTILLIPAMAGGARRRLPTESRNHGGSKIGSWWTHELVGYALDNFHRKHLRTPTVRELRGGIEELPSFATICLLYGSVGRMLRFHGYRVRARGGQPGRPCNLERDARGRFLPKRQPLEATG